MCSRTRSPPRSAPDRREWPRIDPGWRERARRTHRARCPHRRSGPPAAAPGTDRGPWLAGALGGAIGTLCCAGPAIGVALGLGTGSFLLGLADRRFLLFGIGALLAGVVVALQYRRHRRACPTPAAAKALHGRFLDAAILAFGLTYVVGRVVVPRLIEALT